MTATVQVYPADASDLARLAKTVREVGRSLLEADRSHLGTRLKSSRRDMVTAHDKRVQAELVELLSREFPGVGFQCEEGEDARQEGGIRFVIDPIDGTANFVHGTGCSAVSVGLVDGNEPVIGVVYNPFHDELFAARRGGGATLNEQPLPQIPDADLQDSLVCIGTSPYFPDLFAKTMALLVRRASEFNDIRRDGSAALDLCYVGAARYGLFFEMSLAPWDIAAGTLVARECGARVCTMEGGGLAFAQRTSVLAGSPRAVEQFLAGERRAADGAAERPAEAEAGEL